VAVLLIPTIAQAALGGRCGWLTPIGPGQPEERRLRTGVRSYFFVLVAMVVELRPT